MFLQKSFFVILHNVSDYLKFLVEVFQCMSYIVHIISKNVTSVKDNCI